MPTAEKGNFQYDDDEELNHRRMHKNHGLPTYQDFEANGEDKKKSEKCMPIEEAELEEPPNQTCGEVWRDYPKSVLCIVGNEFCERFSYYGMRAVLTLYLVKILSAVYGYNQQTKNTATAIYSGFVMLCYFSPILGSILADGYIGKFHTILWVSLFYAAGNVTLAVAASFGDTSVVHPWLDFIGMIIIGLGTGGIKPCVQTFGGDQFRKGQERQLGQFFSIFYFAINAGSTISMLLTPIFRTQPCQGQESCYPLAFGIPAALMVVAVMFFAVGSYWYKKVPPEGNVFAKVAKVSAAAVKNKRTFEMKRDHWLDHYMDSHSCACDEECRDRGSCEKSQFVNDIKALLRVLVVYVPLPIFWALYEQQGSTWVLQGTQMNSEIAEGVYFLPDQMGVLNAVLILVLIPTFQVVVYPLLGKIVKLTPLRKMSAGGLLAGVSYVICMAIQFQITPTLARLPDPGQTLFTVANYVQDCKDVRFIAKHGNEVIFNQTISKNENYLFEFSNLNGELSWDVDKASEACGWIDKHKGNITSKLTVYPNSAVYTIFTSDMTDLQLHTTNTDKSTSGESVFTMNFNYYAKNSDDVKVIKACKDATTDAKDCKNGKAEVYKEFEINNRTTPYKDLKPGTWGIYLDNNTTPVGNFTTKTNGGIFSTTLFTEQDGKITHEIMRQAPDNTVSILWQVPQYFVISVAEILFSITGNEFAYSQAPLSMKALVMALWLLTDSVGNVIILIISMVSTAGFNVAWIFLIYAGLMFTIMILFMFIALRYKYTLYVRNDK